MLAHIGIGLLAVAVGAASAPAVTDDLQCYKITNLNLKKLKGVVDLHAPSIGLAPGCKLGKARLYCTPAETTVRPGTLFDGSIPLETIPFSGAPGDIHRICYGVTCKSPAGTGPDQVPIDRFGVHQLGKLKTSMVCTTAALSGVVPTGFQITTPNVELPPGQEITYCYYFRTPNNHTTAIKKWTSHMPASVRRAVLVFTNRDVRPPGTLSDLNCGLFNNNPDNDAPAWAYRANEPDAEFEFPADDGTGTPVAQVVPGGQSAFLWMDMANPNFDGPVTANVRLNATEYPVAMPVTQAHSYLTFNAGIDIPPGASVSETLTCDVPAGAKFFSMSTHSNKQSVHTFIKDGASTVFDSTDFAHPGSRRDGPPFFSFASGELTYQCDYVNPNFYRIRTGDSVATDEMCNAVTFFFPSTRPRFCFNQFLLP